MQCNTAKYKAGRRMLFGFHAVNRGSNPLGDAKEIQGLRVKSKSFFRMWGIVSHTLWVSLKNRGKKIFGAAFRRVFLKLSAEAHLSAIMSGRSMGTSMVRHIPENTARMAHRSPLTWATTGRQVSMAAAPPASTGPSLPV